jgi:hypothetical protein
MLNLVLELTRRPSSIAKGENGALRPLSACNRLEDVERCGQANAFIDRQR